MYPHLVVLALVLEGLGAAVGGGLAFVGGAGHLGEIRFCGGGG